jgi:hypothetical protein
MANTKVTLIILAKLGPGRPWQRFNVIRDRSNNLRPGFGLVGGVPTKFKQYVYQLRSYEGSRTKYRTVGMDPEYADAQLVISQENRLAAKDAGVTVVEIHNRHRLPKEVELYLARLTKRPSVDFTVMILSTIPVKRMKTKLPFAGEPPRLRRLS